METFDPGLQIVQASQGHALSLIIVGGAATALTVLLTRYIIPKIKWDLLKDFIVSVVITVAIAFFFFREAMLLAMLNVLR